MTQLASAQQLDNPGQGRGKVWCGLVWESSFRNEVGREVEGAQVPAVLLPLHLGEGNWRWYCTYPGQCRVPVTLIRLLRGSGHQCWDWEGKQDVWTLARLWEWPSTQRSVDKRICLQCRRPRFNSWVGKILCRRKWQPTPVFFPGQSHGWRRLAVYSLWGHKSWTWLSD